MRLHRATGTGSTRALSGEGVSPVLHPPTRGAQRQTADDLLRCCFSSRAPRRVDGSVSNATTLATVQSNSSDQSASLLVHRQNLVDGVDVVFRQNNAGGCHVLAD